MSQPDKVHVYLCPAQLVFFYFGGVSATAKLLDIDKASVARWAHDVERRGAGGLIPSRHRLRILSIARARGIPLDSIKLDYGDTVEMRAQSVPNRERWFSYRT